MFNKQIKNVMCVVTLLGIVGCTANHNMNSNTSQTASGNTLPYSFSNFSDIPIPEQSEMNMTQTAIYGRGTEWLGRLVFSTPYSVGGVYDFYVEEMKKFAWVEITSVRGINSVLTFMRGNRVALIQLQPSTFRGTDVLFTVSPAPNKSKSENKNTVIKTKQNFKQYNVTKPVNKNTYTNINDNFVNDENEKQDNINTNQPKKTMEPIGTGTIESKRIDTMPLSQSNLFVSPDARKAMAGSLELGEASNQYYKSKSKGVGKPVEM